MTTFNPGQLGQYVGFSSQPPLPQKALDQIRATNIANYLAGAKIAAPAWITLTAYVVGNCVTIPTGQVLTCVVAGTSGASAPAYSPTVLVGRNLVDGTVTWAGCNILNGVSSDVAAPTATLYASAAAASLTETNLISGTLSPFLTCFGGVLTRQGFQNAAAAFTFASGPAAGSGNTTALATNSGYSNAYVYSSYAYDIELMITDTVVGLTFVNSTGILSVEIDGVLMMGNAPLGNATAGQCLVFDFNGILKRRRVTINCSTPVGANVLRGVALSTVGYIEVTDSPNDQMLLLGDSILQTISPAVGMPIAYLGSLIKRYLGLSGTIDAAIGGSGYIAQANNTFNALNVLSNSVNQTLFKAYAPGHILICEGYNDIGVSTPAAVAAAALQTWQAARNLLPNAKITVTDGFSQNKGPDAATLAQAAAITAQFNLWADPNSKLIASVGTSATTAWMRGTGTGSGGIVAGNSCCFVGTDNVHPSPAGADYYGYRIANAIKSAWNNAY